VTTRLTPPGCYAGQYAINPAYYPRVSEAFGGCDWWPAALHPTMDIWTAPRRLQPRVGAAILFAPHEQGAGSAGHWGVVVAISPDGRFVLSSEMNSTIYGRFRFPIGGFGRVVYRYIRVDGWRTAFVSPSGGAA